MQYIQIIVDQKVIESVKKKKKLLLNKQWSCQWRILKDAMKVCNVETKQIWRKSLKNLNLSHQ
jgi:hypothetical protein